jgi:tetratricopeptide (TPR) repeat protein
MVCALTVLAIVVIMASPAAAQATAECATADCPADARQQAPAAQRQLWLDAAAIHQLKLQFVGGLQRFTRAQAGTFGDEGAELILSLATMRDVLARWDAAVKELQLRAARLPLGAEVHVALATVLLDRHSVEAALRELDSARRMDDGRADVYTLQALAYGLAERAADAARALRNAAAIDPDNPATFHTLAQYAAKLDRPEDVARALRGFHRALQRRGAAASRATSGAQPFERADLLRQVAGVAPIFPQARYNDGFAALRTGDYAAAVARFTDAVAIDPLVGGDRGIRRRVAEAVSVLRQGQIQEAIRLLLGALVDAPDDSEAHRVLGLVYWIDDQPGRSIDHLRSAIRLAPADERARATLADVLLADRRATEAERELRHALDAGLRAGQIHYRLGQLYHRQSLFHRAVESFEASGAFGPIVGQDAFFQTIGSLLVNQSDFDGAVAAYLRRVDVNPNNGEAHRQLGEVYFLQGRHDAALAAFATASWLDPGDARAHAATGLVYVRTLQYAEAVAALERALALDGGLKEARYALGTALMRLGRAEQARQEIAKVERLLAGAAAIGQREFQLDAIRREASRSVVGKNYDHAVALFTDALEADPRAARSHRDLGLALLRAQRPSEAIAHLETAKRLEETAEVLDALADAYALVGSPSESTRHRGLLQELVQREKLERLRELGR